MSAAAGMWKYFGINLIDQYELVYDDWLVMVRQSDKLQAEEAKEGKRNG